LEDRTLNLSPRRNILKQQRHKIQQENKDFEKDTPEIYKFPLKKFFTPWIGKKFRDSEASQLIEVIHSKDSKLQLYGMIGLRDLLSSLISI